MVFGLFRILLVFGLFLALGSTLTPTLNMQTLDDPRKWLPPAWRETASGLSPPRAREVAVGARAKLSRQEEQVSVNDQGRDIETGGASICE